MGSFDDVRKATHQKRRQGSLDVKRRPREPKTHEDDENDDSDDDDDDDDDDRMEDDQHALTLTGASGRRLKRELSRHQLFQGLESPGKIETIIVTLTKAYNNTLDYSMIS